MYIINFLFLCLNRCDNQFALDCQACIDNFPLRLLILDCKSRVASCERSSTAAVSCNQLYCNASFALQYTGVLRFLGVGMLVLSQRVSDYSQACKIPPTLQLEQGCILFPGEIGVNSIVSF